METPLTQHIGEGKTAPNLTQYQAAGGYDGLKKALSQTHAEVLEEVKESNLRGRGGAGFPTGLKWSFVPSGDDAPKTKYVVCNADEMEPGTFKDRMLMEGDPHQLIEGMIIAAYAIAATVGYVFLRFEYVESARRMSEAIAECEENNLLGDNILDTDFSFKLYVHSSAGRYICGEETALINSLEGRRANPRAKPPFPQVSGLWGKPTIVNNVETFCNVPHILRNGASWFQDLGFGDNAGTKIYGVSGRAQKPGSWELPLGTPARDLVEIHAGGMKDGYKLKGWLPGGGSTDFLTEDHLDLAMDYEVIGKAGSRMGTGQLIILDDKTCPVGMTLNLIAFFAQESCGWCTPCRDGLPQIEHFLQKLEDGLGREEDIPILEKFTRFLAPGTTFCALAPGAVEPLQSALKFFRQDFDNHINQKCCPYRQ